MGKVTFREPVVEINSKPLYNRKRVNASKINNQTKAIRIIAWTALRTGGE